VAKVVEGEQQLADHQRHVRQAERVRVRRRERLDGAHQVIAEKADRAPGERRQGLGFGQAKVAQPGGHRPVGVGDLRLGALAGGRLAQPSVRPPQLAPGPEAEKRVAP
jgi:hypothetical protein